MGTILVFNPLTQDSKSVRLVSMELNQAVEITVKESGLIWELDEAWTSPYELAPPVAAWDLSDAQTERINESYSKRLLIEIAETAVRLAKIHGASEEDVDTLTLLINDVTQ